MASNPHKLLHRHLIVLGDFPQDAWRAEGQTDVEADGSEAPAETDAGGSGIDAEADGPGFANS